MSRLRTETLDDGRERLLEDFSSGGVTVPKGFITDGASTPRLFWSVIPRLYRTKKAACVHDWLCRNARDAKDRKAADMLFHKMLLEAGLNKIRARVGYIGVRVGAFIGSGVYYPHWTDRV